MHINDLSTSALASLRKPRPYPAVSVVLPTHRRATGTAEDQVRLRNLIAGAVRRVEGDPQVGRDQRFDVIEQLTLGEEAADLRNAQDALVVLAAPGEHQVWQLPRRASERVVIGDTFLTRNLVAAHAQSLPYWVLTVSADGARLWGGSDDYVREERRAGFPLRRERIQTDPERLQRIGDVSSTYRDEETLSFLRRVDATLGDALAQEPRPLYLVGVVEGLSTLESVGPHARTAVGRVHKGGMEDGPGPVLAQELRPARAAVAERRARQALERLNDARSSRRFAAGLDEVWQTAREARIGMLAVEEPFREAARVVTGHLTPAPDARGSEPATSPRPPGVREDVVDELVEASLGTGAEVVFVPDGALAEHGRVAAALRY